MKLLTLIAALLAVPAAAQPVAAPLQAFICSDGTSATLTRDDPAGLITATRSGETFTMFAVVGSKVPRFVSGSDSVDLEPDQVILRRRGTARLVCKAQPDAPVAGTIWGTVTKLDRMALVPGTQVKVMLVDVSRADAPSIELGSTLIVTGENQMPLAFLLTYDPARIRPGMTYALQARMTEADGRLIAITDTMNQALKDGAPQPPMELKLVRTGSPAQP